MTRQIHSAEDSLLSTTSGFVDYRGLLNQCLVLLVVSTGRLVLENIQIYGLHTRFVPVIFIWTSLSGKLIAAPLIACLLIFSIDSSFGNKLFLLKRFLETIIVSFLLILPVVEFNLLFHEDRQIHPVTAVIVLFFYLTICLKLISFCAREQQHKTDLRLLSGQFIYFILAPTLVFQYEYPRNTNIRWSFVARRIIEITFLGSLLMIIGERWIAPIIDTDPVSVNQFSDHPMSVLLKLLKLALPNHVAWVTCFYLLFHSLFNLTGELLRFADRCFYLDWWNAGSPAEFWRKWNVPVHRFAHKHLYKPLCPYVGPLFAGYVVFFVSALAHEYVASVSLRVPGSYMFIGMMVQPVLGQIMRMCLQGEPRDSRRKWTGNLLLWVAVIFGQPITAMMYVNDYRYSHRLTEKL